MDCGCVVYSSPPALPPQQHGAFPLQGLEGFMGARAVGACQLFTGTFTGPNRVPTQGQVVRSALKNSRQALIFTPS